MIKDPIVDGVRRVRDKLAAEYDFDIHTLFEHIRFSQSEYGSRLVNRSGSAGEQADSLNPLSAALLEDE